jgi:hypothetical protein
VGIAAAAAEEVSGALDGEEIGEEDAAVAAALHDALSSVRPVVAGE